MVCHACSDDTTGNGGFCHACGRALPTFARLEPAVARAVVYQPSIIRDGRDQDSGDHVIQVDDPSTSSETRRASDGTIITRIRGAPNAGRPGEKRLLKTLRQVLAGNGYSVEQGEASDARGEDGKLTINGREMVVQAVTVPDTQSFWRDARVGATLSVDTAGALGWIASAIDEKAGRTSAPERGRTILAIDVRHWGLLVSPTLVDEYLTKYSEPSSQYGLAAIWLVGPTNGRCLRLGQGWP